MPIHTWHRMKPQRPVLNRAHGLCRGMVFASCPGWTYGFTSTALQTDSDDFTLVRGTWTGAINASPWSTAQEAGGRGIDNGDGSFNQAPEWIPPASDTRYDVTRGWSAAVLVRPDVLITDATIPLFKRRDQPYGATEEGWHFSGAASNFWRVAICDGASEASATGTTAMALTRADLLVATYDRANLRLYVNGTLEKTTATTIAVAATSGLPIKFLGLGTSAAGSPSWPGLVSMGAVWKRALTEGEAGALYRDPFTMWRNELGDEAAVDYQTFLAAF